MYVDTKRQKINGVGPATFIDVPPGKYYIVVVPEGGNARQTQFRKIKGVLDDKAITFDITAIDPVGRITAIVLVGGGGQRTPSPGDVVTIQGDQNGYYDCCMTDINGVAVFQAVPEGEIYEVVAEHNSATQIDSCDLKSNGNCAKQFRFTACPICGR